MSNQEALNLERIVKTLQARLERSNKKPDTRHCVRANLSDGDGFLIALVEKNAPMSDHPQCPWDTRYVFLYKTDGEELPIHVYFFDEPYNPEEDNDKVFTNAHYSDSKESQNLLYYHAFEHLTLGITPINASKSLLKI